jgi:hypothetical protein
VTGIDPRPLRLAASAALIALSLAFFAAALAYARATRAAS